MFKREIARQVRLVCSLQHPRHNAVISAYTANTASDLPKVGDGCLEKSTTFENPFFLNSSLWCSIISNIAVNTYKTYKYILNLEDVMSCHHNDDEF